MDNNFLTKDRSELISDYIIKRAEFEKQGVVGSLLSGITSGVALIPALSFGIPLAFGYGYHNLNRKAEMSRLVAQRRQQALDDKIKELYDEGL